MSNEIKYPFLVKEVLQMDNRIVLVRANSEDYSVELTYADGESYVLDFSRKVQTNEWTRQMADPETFAAVKIGDLGYCIEWPTGYDCCADALRWDGELARRGLTRADVGEQ